MKDNNDNKQNYPFYRLNYWFKSLDTTGFETNQSKYNKVPKVLEPIIKYLILIKLWGHL